MKKILLACFSFLFFTAALTAQRGSYLGPVRSAPSISRLERVQLQRDVFRLRVTQRQARRDGIVTPYERRKVRKLKQRTRRDAFRFRHNRRDRVI